MLIEGKSSRMFPNNDSNLEPKSRTNKISYTKKRVKCHFLPLRSLYYFCLTWLFTFSTSVNRKLMNFRHEDKKIAMSWEKIYFFVDNSHIFVVKRLFFPYLCIQMPYKAQNNSQKTVFLIRCVIKSCETSFLCLQHHLYQKNRDSLKIFYSQTTIRKGYPHLHICILLLMLNVRG